MIDRIKNLPNAKIKAYRDWEYHDGMCHEIKSVECVADVNNFVDIVGDRPLYLLPKQLAGSDYSDSSPVETANHRVFTAKFECIRLYGFYDYYGVALSIDWLCDPKNKEVAEAIMKTLEGLENYSVIDHATLSEVEMELSGEAWECWVKDDLIATLNKLHDIDIQIDENESAFYTLFNEVMDRTNECWQPDGNNMTINLDRVAEAFDLEELEPFDSG